MMFPALAILALVVALRGAIAVDRLRRLSRDALADAIEERAVEMNRAHPSPYSPWSHP